MGGWEHWGVEGGSIGEWRVGALGGGGGSIGGWRVGAWGVGLDGCMWAGLDGCMWAHGGVVMI